MFGSDAVTHDAFALLIANYLGYGREKPTGLGIFEQRTEASPLEISGWFEPAIIGQGGIEVEQFDRAGRDTCDCSFGQSNNEGDTRYFFKKQLFLPLPMFAEGPA